MVLLGGCRQRSVEATTREGGGGGNGAYYRQHDAQAQFGKAGVNTYRQINSKPGVERVHKGVKRRRVALANGGSGPRTRVVEALNHTVGVTAVQTSRRAITARLVRKHPGRL